MSATDTPTAWLWASLVCVALVTSACSDSGSGSGSGSPVGSTVDDTSMKATTADGTASDESVPGDEPADELFAEGDLVLGTGDFTLPRTDDGLGDLNSYRATLVLSFDGTRAGAPEAWSTTYTMLATKDPATRHLTIERSGDLPDVRTVVMAEAEEVVYERVGDDACSARVVEVGTSLGEQMEPAGFLTRVYGATAVGSETIAGVAADHYTFDDQALGQQDIAPSTGEVWVAPDSALVVKYLLSTDGGPEYFGEGGAGTVSWDYQLTDIDAPVESTVPEGCPAGVVTAPTLPDATNVSSLPGVLTYETASSVADASAFYVEQLAALGWVPAETPAVSESVVFQTYQRADQTLTVLVATGAAATTVSLLMER